MKWLVQNLHVEGAVSASLLCDLGCVMHPKCYLHQFAWTTSFFGDWRETGCANCLQSCALCPAQVGVGECRR